MDNDNLGGEKAIIEERRKKLDQLREKGDAYSNSFKPKNNALKLMISGSAPLIRTRNHDLSISNRVKRKALKIK